MSAKQTSAKVRQKTLLSRVEYEQKVFEKWNPQHLLETPNGIECPQCPGQELIDGTSKILTNPPKLRMTCKTCDYQGYRTLPPEEV